MAGCGSCGQSRRTVQASDSQPGTEMHFAVRGGSVEGEELFGSLGVARNRANEVGGHVYSVLGPLPEAADS